MAKEKKTQASTGKKKTTQAKNKNVGLKNNNKANQKISREISEKGQKQEKEQISKKKKIDNKKEVKKAEDTKKMYHSENQVKEETKNYKIKNKNEKMVSSSVISSDEMGKLVKIILILIAIVIVFYGLTVVITKFQKNSVPDRNKNTTPAVIQYDEILIGTMLNQARDEYYVLIQKDDDPYRSLISYYLQKYNADSKSLKVYLSNINSIYNQFYISENSNIKSNNLSEFKAATITLIKVKNHEIVEAYEGLEEVEKAFKVLTSKE